MDMVMEVTQPPRAVLRLEVTQLPLSVLRRHLRRRRLLQLEPEMEIAMATATATDIIRKKRMLTVKQIWVDGALI